MPQQCGCDESVGFLCVKHASERDAARRTTGIAGTATAQFRQQAQNIGSSNKWQLQEKLLDDVIGCALRIIRGGLTGDKALVAAYADLMADRLEDASHSAMKHVREAAKGEFGKTISAYAHDGRERDPLTEDFGNNPEGD